MLIFFPLLNEKLTWASEDLHRNQLRSRIFLAYTAASIPWSPTHCHRVTLAIRPWGRFPHQHDPKKIMNIWSKKDHEKYDLRKIIKIWSEEDHRNSIGIKDHLNRITRCTPCQFFYTTCGVERITQKKNQRATILWIMLACTSYKATKVQVPLESKSTSGV